MAEKKQKRGLLRAGGRLWAESLGLPGLVETIKRLLRFIPRLLSLLARRQPRVETFSQAVERTGVDEVEISRRAGAARGMADALTIVAFLCSAATVYGGLTAWSFPVVSLLALVATWCGAHAITWAFRAAQLRDRELFSFGDWLRGRRPGEFK